MYAVYFGNIYSRAIPIQFQLRSPNISQLVSPFFPLLSPISTACAWDCGVIHQQNQATPSSAMFWQIVRERCPPLLCPLPSEAHRRAVPKLRRLGQLVLPVTGHHLQHMGEEHRGNGSRYTTPMEVRAKEEHLHPPSHAIYL